MVETNPYETNNDIPEFIGKKKEDVDMSVFKLNQEELEDEEFEEAPKRKVNKQQLVMLITAAVAVVLCVILLFTLVAKSKALTSSQNAYKTLEETTTSKIARLEKEVTELTEDKKALEKQVEELKAAQTVVVNPGSNSNSGSGNNNGTTVTPAGSYAAGTYTLTAGLKVRTGAGTSYEAKASLSAGDKVTVIEVQTSGTQVWGKVRENEWICLKNGNEAYVK